MTLDQAISLHEQALGAFAARQWAEAERAALQARNLFISDDGPDSPDAANASNLLSRVAEVLAQYRTSEDHARKAWEIMDRLGGRCTGTSAEQIRSEAMANLGTALRSQGRYAEAEDWLLQAIRHAQAYSLDVISPLNNLGVLYKYTGRFDEADALYQEALTETHGDDAALATVYHNLGGLNHARQDFATAEPYARRAWELRKTLLWPDYPDSLADACALAGVLDGLGRYGESEPIYRHALCLFEKIFGEMHPEAAATLNNLAAVRAALRDTSEAESLYLRSLSIKRRILGPSHPDTALTLHNYAFMLADLERFRESRPMALEAQKIFSANLELSHPRIAAAQALSERIRNGLGPLA